MFVLTRNIEKSLTLQTKNIHTIVGDLDSDYDIQALIPTNAHIYYFAPPPSSGEQDSRLRTFLTKLDKTNLPEAIVYISTTGVYGDPGHNQVTNEDTPTQPKLDRGKRRLDAEQQLLKWNKQFPQTRTIILRVAGIYGPDKLPIERIKRQDPILDPSEPSYVNLIHIEDLAQACFQAMRHGKPGEAYNVCDGHPILMTHYIQAIVEAFKLPQPPVISMKEAEQKLSPGFLSYLKESRRIDNQKMLKELGIELRHPLALDAIKVIAPPTNN